MTSSIEKKKIINRNNGENERWNEDNEIISIIISKKCEKASYLQWRGYQWLAIGVWNISIS
jgi:hypothetical protein